MSLTAVVPDLSLCDREPIHIPGSIQPHGFLLALDRQNLRAIQASKNVSQFLDVDAPAVLGRALPEIFGSAPGSRLARQLASLPHEEPAYLPSLSLSGAGEPRAFSVVAHRSGESVVLEMEPRDAADDLSLENLYSLVQSFLSRSRNALSLSELAQLAVEEVRTLTGFDRVLLYKFDNQWNGHVLAEAKDDEYSSYLDLWFPASDIPAQARKLYALNRFRLIADVSYLPVPLVPQLNPPTSSPLDLSFSSLRSVSPVHVEYLKNMGVAASMSISILTRDGRLWGLIACHHRSPRRVPIEARTSCDFLAQTLGVQLQTSEEREEYRRRIELSSRTADLLALMAREESFVDGLLNNPQELLAYVNAQGAAVLFGGNCTLIGETPGEEEVRDLVAWLIGSGRVEQYATSHLSSDFPQAESYASVASGVLAIPISQIHQSYILWFRPEMVQTVNWSGDPRKSVQTEQNGSMRIHPRKSFEIWSETVRGRSLPWSETELDAVVQFRSAVVGVVLRKAEELAAVSEELQRSNSELAAFSYSVSHDLRAPFRHIVGFAELLLKSNTAQLGERDRRYVNTIIESAQFAGTLVDNLLSFSQVGRTKLELREVDSNKVVSEVRRSLQFDCTDRNIQWRVAHLPQVHADLSMLQMIWQNLLHNAIKYTRKKDVATIEISSETLPREYLFRVRDNGVGFEQAYADKLFGVFQRLHRMEDFEGTGIGLANVRRAVGRHGGRTWAEGEPGVGASLYFTLPRELNTGTEDGNA